MNPEVAAAKKLYNANVIEYMAGHNWHIIIGDWTFSFIPHYAQVWAWHSFWGDKTEAPEHCPDLLTYIKETLACTTCLT